MDAHTYTLVSDFFTCDDCGAYAKRREDVKHAEDCDPGASSRWERFYDDAEPDDPAELTRPSRRPTD